MCTDLAQAGSGGQVEDVEPIGERNRPSFGRATLPGQVVSPLLLPARKPFLHPGSARGVDSGQGPPLLLLRLFFGSREQKVS